jgi:hypothetical protein
MDREKTDELLHSLVHRAIERGELVQVLADQRLLLGILFQNPLGDVIASDANLLEAVLHATESIGDELEARIVE